MAARRGEIEYLSVPGTDARLPVFVDEDGVPWGLLRKMCDALGVAYQPQFRKLKQHKWAVVTLKVTTGSDGKRYEMIALGSDAIIMWLATMNASKITNPVVRSRLEGFQCEVAGVLRDYFTKGAAINPSATPEQLKNVFEETKRRLDVLHAARGIVDAAYLEQRAKIEIGRTFGEAPAIPSEERVFYAADYLAARGVSTGMVRKYRSAFGAKVKKRYIEERGVEPPNHPIEANGRIVNAAAYTDSDRHILDSVWMEHYADRIGGEG
jgi:hypothetical protein